MKIRSLLVFAFAIVSAAAFAVESYNVSGTIAVTNTFQPIREASSTRLGCTVQNNGANTEWVFFGPIASATKAKSVVLTPGQSVSCTLGTASIGDQISITGTAGDAFFAATQ